MSCFNFISNNMISTWTFQRLVGSQAKYSRTCIKATFVSPLSDRYIQVTLYLLMQIGLFV